MTDHEALPPSRKESPMTEGSRDEAFWDLFQDWLSERAKQSDRSALEHLPKAPARHYCRGSASAYEKAASALCNGRGWLAADIKRMQAGYEAQRSAPNPPPKEAEPWRPDNDES